MSQFLETILILNGQWQNIEWHNSRFNKTRLIHFGIKQPLEIQNIITIPDTFKAGEVKCRLSYDREPGLAEFSDYNFKAVASLKIIHDDAIDYRFKDADRNRINLLHGKRGNCDDIIIIKNGCVSDSSYSNLVFSDGKDFFTPDSPLLPGTKREKYLSEGIIKTLNIKEADIRTFKEVHLINAFLDLGRCVVKVTDIH